jgi:anti-sigma B factor antagonist
MSGPVEVRQRTENGVPVLEIAGELDASSSATLPDRLLPLIPAGRHVRLDLSQVTYISSAGLRTLLLVYRHAQENGVHIRLNRLPEGVRFVMSATGFLDLFDHDEADQSSTEPQ